MRIASRTLSGVLHAQNKGACDWGWEGMVAYGCNMLVVVVHAETIQTLQTLEGHKSNVLKVKWPRQNYHHDVNNPYSLRLASSDNQGRIIVWDVATGIIKAEFSDGNKAIQELEWLYHQDSGHDFLVALHPPYSLVLWRADTGQKVWKKTYTEVLHTFSFDPFDPRKAAFLGQDCVMFIDDFSVSKVPSSYGKKFYISSPSKEGSGSGQRDSTSGPVEKRSSKNSITIGKRVSQILVGAQPKQQKSTDDEPVAINDCLQLCYHRSCRNHLILLYAKEILILDLEIKQTVGIIPLERSGSPYVQVFPCFQRDALICLHENGGITVRWRRRGSLVMSPTTEQVGTFGTQEDSPVSSQLDMAYDARCQSDPLRLTKHTKVYGMTVCAVSERRVALVMSDSRILIWEMMTTDIQDPMTVASLPALYTPGPSVPSRFTLPPSDSKLPLTSNVPFPKFTLSDMVSHTSCINLAESQKNSHPVNMKFLLTGMTSGLAPPPLVLKMCPPLTTKNFNMYKPLLAIGTSSGLVQVFNVGSGELYREYTLHSCAIKGLDWVSLTSFLSFGYTNPSTSNTVKNEIVLVNIETGKINPFRQNRDEESPIEMIAVSPLKQYFVIVFKDKPFELWDLKTGTLLREMPKNFPHITALCWAPSHSTKSLKRRQTTEGGVSSLSVTDLTSSATMETVTRIDSKGNSTSAAKEHFVFTDNDGLLYHFIVEGNLIRDGSKIPPESGMGSITSIAWKSDTMVLGDVEGNLNIWDLKARISKAVPTHRGWIKKIKFAPGRGNHKLFVIFNDGADIWDIKDVEKVSSVKCPKELPKISDADWAASDKPIFATVEGCVRIMDITLKGATAPLTEYHLKVLAKSDKSVSCGVDTLYSACHHIEPLFCPYLLSPQASMTLKYTLQHQPWQTYTLMGVEGIQDETDEVQNSVNVQLKVLDSDVKEYLPNCSFGTAERCLLTARLFGDESDLHFWTIALHYLKVEKAEPISKTLSKQSSQASQLSVSSGDIFRPTTTSSSQDLVVFEEDEKEASDKASWGLIKERPLDTCYDVLCDSLTFQKYQLDRVTLHDTKRATYEHTKKCVENLTLLGQADRAVQLLLETEADSDSYYVDCLRACLVASIRSSGASQSTIKLVATNLIANGKLSEGIQLLCLIDKGLDACRYLQTYGEYDQSVWLAKSTLNAMECTEVIKRWVDHLCSASVNQKSKAILVLLSLRQFWRVVEMLYSLRQFDRATLFLEACLEFGVLEKNEETSALMHAVFLEYARQMMNLQNKTAAVYYCNLAGDKGAQLLKEIQILFE